MKIFILGLPKSGKTTISKSISEIKEFNDSVTIDSMGWINSFCRPKQEKEHEDSYEELIQENFVKRITSNLDVTFDYSMSIMNSQIKNTYIFDSVASPYDFIKMFDGRRDKVIFLNRVDDRINYRDYDNISLSAIKDYCFWLSATNLLPKTNWIEYNFKIPGSNREEVRMLGAKNSIFIVGSIEGVMKHLHNSLVW